MRHHLSHVLNPLLPLGILIVHIPKMLESAVFRLVSVFSIMLLGNLCYYCLGHKRLHENEPNAFAFKF